MFATRFVVNSSRRPRQDIGLCCQSPNQEEGLKDESWTVSSGHRHQEGDRSCRMVLMNVGHLLSLVLSDRLSCVGLSLPCRLALSCLSETTGVKMTYVTCFWIDKCLVDVSYLRL